MQISDTICQKIVCEALDNLEDLDEWENEFILDLSEKPDHYTFSSSQKEKLIKISSKLEDL